MIWFMPCRAGGELSLAIRRERRAARGIGFSAGETNRSAVQRVATRLQLTDEMTARMNAWWRAANYLSIGQMYLLDNPLRREKLSSA